MFTLAFPEQSALLDFEFEDFAFSSKNQETALADTNVLIVNIGNLSRTEIAQELEIIGKYEPKVIGMDILFSNARDTLGSGRLSRAIHTIKNVVMATKLVYSDSIHAFTSLKHSEAKFRTQYEGFENLDSDVEYYGTSGTLRTFTPSATVNDSHHLAFAVQIAMLYDPIKTKRFLARSNEREIINYTGNIVDFMSSGEYPFSFYTLDSKDILEGNFLPGIIKDRVVILGFVGEVIGDPAYEQKYYTSLNKIVFGKGLPDMFGVAVHANIVGMIVKEDYVNKISSTAAIITSIIIIFLNALFFSWLHSRNTVWHEVFTLLVPAAQIMLIATLRYFLFASSKYVLDLSFATILLVGVSFSASLYWGPVINSVRKIQNRLGK